MCLIRSQGLIDSTSFRKLCLQRFARCEFCWFHCKITPSDSYSSSSSSSSYIQDHYDWGLRAIKSVLVVAGSLKRSDRDRPEDQVLMRALRDFNIPKIVTDDVPVFMGLIGDLFPALDVPRKRDMDFEALVKKSALVSFKQFLLASKNVYKGVNLHLKIVGLTQ